MGSIPRWSVELACSPHGFILGDLASKVNWKYIKYQHVHLK